MNYEDKNSPSNTHSVIKTIGTEEFTA